MAHRCSYGDKLFEVFIGKVNSDQTEGRGRMRESCFSLTAEGAHGGVKGQGVMGVGDGDVWFRQFYTCDADGTGEKCDKVLVRDTQVFDGYAARGGKLKGYGPDGWVPQYSPLLNDPEYKTYIRLKEKFENG